MLDPNLTLQRMGGLARAGHLESHGFTRIQLSRLVRSGVIQRVRPGIYASNDLDPELHTAVARGGALTCGSMLRRHGVWVLSSDLSPHVWVGEKGVAFPHLGCDCVTHFFNGSAPLGQTDVETALLHLYLCSGDEAFFAAFESARKLRQLSAAARHRIRLALPSVARWLVDIARPDAESGLESILRLRMHLIGIRLASQVSIPGVGRVDFVIDDLLILEADGKENHDDPLMRHKDLKRDAAASALGYETLRFDYAQILYEWPSVQAAILAALARLRDRT